MPLPFLHCGDNGIQIVVILSRQQVAIAPDFLYDLIFHDLSPSVSSNGVHISGQE
jgi:hypothetical protein